MTYGVKEFCAETRAAIDPKTRKADLEAVRRNLEKLLSNKELVQELCGPGAQNGIHELYRDPETDFVLLAHVYPKGRTSPPHDHGASWAVYGQAVGWTEMTEYERLDDGKTAGRADIKVARTYRLEPGKAGVFGPHEIHRINFPDGARFIRCTGTDLASIDTFSYDMEAHRIKKSDRTTTAGAVSA